MPAKTNDLYDTSGDTGIGGGSASAIGRTRLPRTKTPNPNVGFRNVTDGVGTGGSTYGQAAPGQQTIGGTGGLTAASTPIGPAPTFPSSGYPGGGTNPVGGWAASMGYTPADIMGMNQMPARYLYDILRQRGMDPTGGLFYMMEPLADIMMPLYELIYGNRRDIIQGFDTNDIANFMGNMFGEMMTPGGRMPNVGELWNNMLNPGGEQSILFNLLNVGTPEEQVENLRRYAMMLGQLSGSPMYQQALSNYLSRRGYDYLQGFTGGNQPTTTFGQLVGGVGM